MTSVLAAPAAIWLVAGLATAGVIIRPFRWPEAVWAVAGAVLLVALGLLPWREAWTGIRRGTDVYLFLIGMMLLAEVGRRGRLFDWLARLAVRMARGSARRLFGLVYAVGVLVTVFLSNDATAVVLTPAVYAAARVARADPMPYLFACALVANAASFVLPISNPANLVVYGAAMPSLPEWLRLFTLPSILSIAATFLVLRATQRRRLAAPIAQEVPVTPLPWEGVVAGIGIVATVAAMLAASAGGRDLGLPTFLAGLGTALLVMLVARQRPGAILAGVSWSVLPLVAGLFVLVQGLEAAGTVGELAGQFGRVASAELEAWGAGAGVALLSNLVNNLPMGLLAGAVVQAAGSPPDTVGAILIGVDLGPNLSVTGSLATLLWLVAIRREGQDVSAWSFLKLGALVMPPALLLSLAALIHRPF